MHDFLISFNHPKIIAKAMYYNPDEFSIDLGINKNFSVLHKLTLTTEAQEKNSIRYAEAVLSMIGI